LTWGKRTNDSENGPKLQSKKENWENKKGRISTRFDCREGCLLRGKKLPVETFKTAGEARGGQGGTTGGGRAIMNYRKREDGQKISSASHCRGVGKRKVGVFQPNGVKA